MINANLIEDLKIQLEGYYDDLVVLLPKLVMGVIIVLFIWFLTKPIKKRLLAFIKSKSSDPLLANFISRLFNVIIAIIIIAIFLHVVNLGNIAAGLVGTAGVGAFIIGFAFKDVGEHFLAGFILAFNRPFQIGDIVELDGERGRVISLNIRDTQLKTPDGRDLFIPNGNIIKNTLVNYTIDGFMRQEVVIGLDYNTDISEAIKIVMGEMNQIPRILQEEKAPSVSISNLTPSTIDLSVFYWLDTFDKSINVAKLKITIIKRLLGVLTAAGINLPGNIIELKNYGEKRLDIAMSDATAINV